MSDPRLDEVPPESSTVDHVPADAPGSRIGPYKLLQQIGEGGMGVVFMAEQEQPVRRRVALKIIKPGMDSVSVVNRFRAEQQALALMDHQNIAKVHDAGTTAAGRPYFVMELVHGVPITKYCDDNKLTPRERLAIFLPVCRAVQHAHQKGIIHRDLKPSNVLVCLYDGKPVAKVIDFGVAKAMEQPLTDGTMFTQFGQVIGTLEYMSPEQAEMIQLGIDTRSDIYSLGVMLYELLTGSTPLQRARIKQAAFDEILKLIREEEPPPPSSRLSKSTETLPAISQQRRMEPTQLANVLRGELDWIVMKSLEKDRTRRYATADNLARDLERYLTDEPVEAGPPSATYRLRKYARKHRALLTTAAAFAVLLLAGTAVSVWQAVRASNAEGVAIQAGDQAKKGRVAAEKARDELKSTTERLRTALYVADLNLVKTAADAGQMRRALQILEGHRPKAGEEDLRGFEWFWWKRQLRSESETVSLEGFVTDNTLRSGYNFESGWFAFSPSGRKFAALQSLEASDSNIAIWDAVTGKLLRRIPWTPKPDPDDRNARMGAARLEFSGDESMLRVGAQNLTKRFGGTGLSPSRSEVFSLRSGERLYEASDGKLRFHPDGKRVLLLRTKSKFGKKVDLEPADAMLGTTFIWCDTKTGTEQSRFAIGLGIHAISDDCRRIAREVPGKRSVEILEHVDPSEDRKSALIAFVAKTGKQGATHVRLADIATGDTLWEEKNLGYAAAYSVFNSDGSRVFLNGLGPAGVVSELRELPSGKTLFRLEDAGGSYLQSTAYFTPDDRRILITEGWHEGRTRVRVLDLAGNELAIIPVPGVVGSSLHPSKDGMRLQGLRPQWEGPLMVRHDRYLAAAGRRAYTSENQVMRQHRY